MLQKFLSYRNKEYIYEIYKTGSFSKAAKNLYISQPALSASIVKIEADLGMKLFNRSSHPITLTEAGQAYIDAIKEIEEVERGFYNKLYEISNLQIGHLTIAGANFFSSCMLPTIMKNFSKKYPAITFEIVESDSIELYKMALDNHIDLILDAGDYDHDIYKAHHILTEEILLAVPKNNPLNDHFKEYQLTYHDILQNKHKEKQDSIPISAFKDETFILMKKGHDMHARSIGICQNYGFQPAHTIYLNQLMTVYNFASQELGIVFVTDTLIKLAPPQDNLVFYKVNDKSSFRSLFLAHKKTSILTKCMEYFIETARTVFQE
ncbi:MAG: LysR family transcriptional regulator [Clostridiales bacterium]|nr:LysR family transcriptional regulator [Clostridiales bacterium]